jgi:hypothetical protein
MTLRAFGQVFFFITLSQLLVAQTPSAVSIFSWPNPAVAGSTVILTATVAPSDATGQIVFL